MEPGTPSLQSTRLLDQVREWIRCQDYIFKVKTIAIFICFFGIAPLRPAVNDTSVRWGWRMLRSFSRRNQRGASCLQAAPPAPSIRCVPPTPASHPNRDPPLPHPRLRLPYGVFPVVEDAGGQHSVGAALLDAVGQVVQVAHAA